MRLVDLFDIAADAYELGRMDLFEAIIEQMGDAGPWYWIIGPERGRPRPVPVLDNEENRDIRYLRKKLFAAIKVPPSYLGYANLEAEPDSDA